MSRFLVNVFEDPMAIREGNWLKRVSQLERVPDDYGVAWYVPDHAVAVCAPMPFHSVIGWAYRTYWRWRMGNMTLDEKSAMYDQGRRDAEAAYIRSISYQRAQFELELRDEVSAAEARGAKQMLARLIADMEWRGGRADN